jgi:hypothetical protein
MATKARKTPARVDTREKLDIQPEAPQGPTSVADFKRTHLVVLPSKLCVTLRRLDLYSLIQSGKIPNPLVAAAYRFVDGASPSISDKEYTPEEELEHKRDQDLARDAMVVALVESPKLVLEEKDEAQDTVWVGRLVSYDKTMIIQLSQTDIGTLANFRPGSTGAGAGSNGPTLWGVPRRVSRSA